MAVGAYMLGNYRRPVDMELISAMVVALAPQSEPVLLKLEIRGVVMDKSLTIPVATVNT
jgi:hypothetical protein